MPDSEMKYLLPFVFHIPHSARSIPTDIRRSILLSEPDLETELIKMTDSYTDELFVPNFEGVQTVVFPVSRLVVDPERFLDDEKEIMSERGMGVIYTCMSAGRPLRNPPSEVERKILIDRYYKPHHLKLRESVAICLQRFGRSTIIDCHSFPSAPLPYEDDQNPNRPDICIGTDNFHTPAHLCQAVQAAAQKQGLNWAINRPFSGAIVPIEYYRKNSKVHSIMIEINRKLYMDEKTGEKTDAFIGCKVFIDIMIQTAIMEIERANGRFTSE